MKRWDIAIVSSGPASITTKLEIQPFESAQGPWVRCDDVSQFLADYEVTRAINVRLQGEVDRLRTDLDEWRVAYDEEQRNTAFWKAEAIRASEILRAAIRSSPNDDGWLHAAQRFCDVPGSPQQALQPAIVPHEHRWSKPHDCGDPKCTATGNVMCLEPNCYARPGADPDGP